MDCARKKVMYETGIMTPALTEDLNKAVEDLNQTELFHIVVC